MQAATSVSSTKRNTLGLKGLARVSRLLLQPGT